MKCVVITILCLVGLSSQQDVLPSVPLVVKSPYLSTWMSARELPGNWPTFWTGAIKGLAGLVRVDDETYEWMGIPSQDPIGTTQRAEQTNLQVTPTQSIFTLTAGPVELKINFFTPVDPTDLRRLSIPASYIAVTARSLDNNTHETRVYIDLSAEWTNGDASEGAEWDFAVVGDELANFDMRPSNPKVLSEASDGAQWGTVKFFTDASATYEANECLQMRTHFVSDGRLPNTIDSAFRAINDRWPGVALVRVINAGPQESARVFYGISYVRKPSVQYADIELSRLWESYFDGDENQMINFFYGDAEDALERANELDARILEDARAAGGESYAKLVSASLRQAYGGTELVGTQEKPWLILKEISSDGNCQTVDVIYPHSPIQLYLNPELLRMLLEPLLDNQESGLFPRDYCMHDLGTSYPRCIGHPDGEEFEAMEVEESANMLIMMAAYVKVTGNIEWARAHYDIAKQWTTFLVDNGLITGEAFTTDDFLGRVINSTNLSIKAIIGIGGMAQLAGHIGNADDEKHYRDIAEDYAAQWRELAQDPSGAHIMMSYNSPDSWFMIYNLWADVLLETGLVPEEVYTQQDDWYKSVANKYGIPLESGQTPTKWDWCLFTAAAATSSELRQLIFDRTAQWLRETPKHVPFSDYADTVSGDSPRFINRPVIGGIFAPLVARHEFV